MSYKSGKDAPRRVEEMTCDQVALVRQLSTNISLTRLGDIPGLPS